VSSREEATPTRSISELVERARSLLHKPFKLGGATAEYGIDNSRYSQMLYGELGIKLMRHSDDQYQQVIKDTRFRCLKDGENRQAGDLVFFVKNFKNEERGYSVAIADNDHYVLFPEAFYGFNKVIRACLQGGKGTGNIHGCTEEEHKPYAASAEKFVAFRLVEHSDQQE